MLKKGSSASSDKQGLMSDYPSLLHSPTERYNRPAASIFTSLKLFVGLSAKGLSETEAAMSPTSTLESRPFANPMLSTRKPMQDAGLASPGNKPHHPWENGDSGPIGLGIVDALKEEGSGSNRANHDKRKVLFGSQLKIQIPTMIPIAFSHIGSVESPNSRIEFGIKTMNSVPGSRSPCGLRSPTVNSGNGGLASPIIFTGTIPAKEIELSEDYTCVITHGPNPRTTHIFENCIVQSCGDQLRTSRVEKMLPADRTRYPSEAFLSFCHTCKKDLGQGRDIYMYRGEKAFCSKECRYEGMLSDEAADKCFADGPSNAKNMQ